MIALRQTLLPASVGWASAFSSCPLSSASRFGHVIAVASRNASSSSSSNSAAPSPSSAHSQSSRQAASSSSSSSESSPASAGKKSKHEQDRKLILDVLHGMPSQREARGFLKRFNKVPDQRLGSSGEMHYRDLVKRPMSNTNSATVSDPQTAAEELIAVGRRQDERLGLIKVQPGLSDSNLSAMANTLVRLRKLGLSPILVIESPPSADYKHQDPINVARERTLKELYRLVDFIEAAGDRAMPIYTGVFQTAPIKHGVDVSVNLDPVTMALGLGEIPVIATLGEDKSTFKHTQVPIREAMLSIAKAMTADASPITSPVKAILINDRGGLTANGQPIGFVNLQHEHDQVRASIMGEWGTLEVFTEHHSSSRAAVRHQLMDLEIARAVLSALPSSSSAIVASATSSAALITNLITDKPLMSGSIEQTLVQPPREHGAPYLPTVLRHGLRVEVHTTLHTLDLPRLQDLLEKSFGRTLDSAKYWKRADGILDTAIVAGNYDGAAIVTHEADPIGDGPPIPYLDKFAVAPTSQGIGVADILWKQLRKKYKNLSWRSRADNPVNKW
ncbi:Amino-acid acetyltransferase, mitochondrial [Gaertneriomyces sp. JEL0708]|nr:Amino-acid acetyltransferase, mitochondrial [Gaertneriomyces sp. JEL0708]